MAGIGPAEAILGAELDAAVHPTPGAVHQPPHPLTQIKNPHKRRTRRVGLTPSELQTVATLLTPGGLPRGGAHHPEQRQTTSPGHATRHPPLPLF